MRGSVVSCEIRSELYLCSFAFGAVRLKYTEPQAATLVFNVPLTVTITMFPILQTTVGTLVMLHSTNVGVTECYAAGNTAMEEMDEAVVIVSLLALMVTVPFASMDMFPLAQSLAIGAMNMLAGRNPSGSIPIVALPHDELIVTLTKRQLTITMPSVLK